MAGGDAGEGDYWEEGGEAMVQRRARLEERQRKAWTGPGLPLFQHDDCPLRLTSSASLAPS